MTKDDKQDDRITTLEVETARLKERQLSRVDKSECEAAKGDIKMTVRTEVDDLERSITKDMGALEVQIVDRMTETENHILAKIDSISPMSLKQKLGLMGGSGAGGAGIVGAILLILKYWLGK